MRVMTKFSLAAAVIAGSLSLSAIAQAHDWDRDRDHGRWEHRYYGHERPVVIERTRPVYVAPQPMYVAPPPAPSGLSLNFNIPLN